jgi:putative transposase
VIGPIAFDHCSSMIKRDILTTIDSAIANGIGKEKICALLQISERRIQRWKKRQDDLDDRKSGPVNAPHALLLVEKDAILKIALNEDYIDDSHRVLAAKAADEGLFFASASSVYKVMRKNNLTADRTGKSHKKGSSTVPMRPVIDASNMRWCWDITYLQTGSRLVNFYLFALLDEYSRKVVAWRISLDMKHENALELLQDGLEKERLDDIDVKLPDLINDRGSQMKAQAFMKLCKDLGINQQFARPRTPNDNPFIESFFSTLKGYHKYPGVFENDIQAITYITEFMDYYNNYRYHGEIGFVTPEQRHSGKDKTIVDKRKKGMIKARKLRITSNKCENNIKNIDKSLVLV